MLEPDNVELFGLDDEYAKSGKDISISSAIKLIHHIILEIYWRLFLELLRKINRVYIKVHQQVSLIIQKISFKLLLKL